MGSSFDRDTVVYVVRLAEHARSYHDMVNEIRNLPKMDMELTEEERILLSIEYLNIIRPRRDTIRMLSLREHNAKWMKKYRQKMAELDSICKRILYVINNHLIPWHTGADSMVFYYKLKGDYNRIRAELSTGNNRNTFFYRSQYAYEVATEAVNPELPSTHHIRLGLALNFAKFYNGILNSPARAYLLVEQALDAAESDLNTLNEEPHKYTISAMKHLRHMQATMKETLEEKSKSGQEEKPGCSTSREIVPQLDEVVAA